MANAFRKGDMVYRTGSPLAVAEIVRIEVKDGQRLIHVAGLPEHAEPWLDVWPERDCVKAS